MFNEKAKRNNFPNISLILASGKGGNHILLSLNDKRSSLTSKKSFNLEAEKHRTLCVCGI